MRCPMTGMAAYRTATGRAAPSAISRPMRWAVPTVPRCCDGWSRMWMSGERLLRGGTGSQSILQEMPEELPDRLEAGTHNMPGIAGLLEGLWFVEQQGVGRIAGHERHLTRHMAALLRDIPGAEVFYTPEDGAQTGVLSFRLDRWDCEALGEALAAQGAAVRAGLHCAPLAHRTAGTLETGTVRCSFSAFSTTAQVEHFARILRQIVR